METTPICVATNSQSTSETPEPAFPDKDIFSPGVTNSPSEMELDMKIELLVASLRDVLQSGRPSRGF